MFDRFHLTFDFKIKVPLGATKNVILTSMFESRLSSGFEILVSNSRGLFGTQEALDHLGSFPSSRETFSQPVIELLITPFGLGTSTQSSGSFGVVSCLFQFPVYEHVSF